MRKLILITDYHLHVYLKIIEADYYLKGEPQLKNIFIFSFIVREFSIFKVKFFTYVIRFIHPIKNRNGVKEKFASFFKLDFNNCRSI